MDIGRLIKCVCTGKFDYIKTTFVIICFILIASIKGGYSSESKIERHKI